MQVALLGGVIERGYINVLLNYFTIKIERLAVCCLYMNA